MNIVFDKFHGKVTHHRFLSDSRFAHQQHIWIYRPRERSHEMFVFAVVAYQKPDLPASREVGEIQGIFVERWRGPRRPSTVHDAMPHQLVRTKRETPNRRGEYSSGVHFPRGREN